MKIDKVHCLFEQSGTFKNEQNEFKQADVTVDLLENLFWRKENDV